MRSHGVANRSVALLHLRAARVPDSGLRADSSSAPSSPRARHLSAGGARSHRARVSGGDRAAARTPTRSARSPRAPRLGAMGRRAPGLRARQALAPRAFDWHYLDAVVLQRLARHADAAAQLRAGAGRLTPDYLPARVEARRSAARSGSARREPPVVRGAASASRRAAPAAELGLGRIAAAQGVTTRRVAHLQRAVALFPEWGAAHYALALSYRALGRRDEAQRALERHAQYGARWPALDDPVLAAVTALRDDRGGAAAARREARRGRRSSRARSRRTRRRSRAIRRSRRRTRT